MQGPELGVHADDVEAPGVEQESKQEVLENKSVRTGGSAATMSLYTISSQTVKLNRKSLNSGGGPEGSHRWPLQNQGGPSDS